MNTKQAFNKLLESLRGANDTVTLEKLDLTPGAVRTLRFDNKNNHLSKEKKEELLKKAGWKKTPEHWESPK